MSTAPSATGRYDLPTTSTQPAVGATTKAAVNFDHATNLPLGVTDLTVMFEDGTPVWGNTLPFYSEMPILFIVKFTNRPAGVEQMVINLVISELGKDSSVIGRGGRFTRYVRSTTFEDTVEIVSSDSAHHSMTIKVYHASAHSSGFHGGDGPYDVYITFTPVAPDEEQDKSVAAEHDDDDAVVVSQVEETLKYTLYSTKTSLLARFFYAVSRFWY
jgi:hypothetical protein